MIYVGSALLLRRVATGVYAQHTSHAVTQGAALQGHLPRAAKSRMPCAPMAAPGTRNGKYFRI